MVNTKTGAKSAIISIERIAASIYLIRGQKGMIDSDLALLYGVETRVLVQAVKRNIARFPEDFTFQLSREEFESWRSQIVISNPGAKKGLRHAPYAFTEQGVAMLSSVLRSERAVEVNIAIVRTFVNYTVHAHQPFQVSVKRNGATTRNLTFPPPSTWPARREKNVMFRDLGGGIGYIRIASWPGILGLDVARETDIAIKRLRSKRLIIDLRGNIGSAGAGNLRIMSYLTPHKIPVGYSLTRRRAQNGYERQELPRFERIPRSKLEIPLVLWRFRKVDKSIVIVTEGLKPQGFHGHITLLVNRHTISGLKSWCISPNNMGLQKLLGKERPDAHCHIPLSSYRATSVSLYRSAITFPGTTTDLKDVASNPTSRFLLNGRNSV